MAILVILLQILILIFLYLVGMTIGKKFPLLIAIIICIIIELPFLYLSIAIANFNPFCGINGPSDCPIPPDQMFTGIAIVIIPFISVIMGVLLTNKSKKNPFHKKWY